VKLKGEVLITSQQRASDGKITLNLSVGDTMVIFHASKHFLLGKAPDYAALTMSDGVAISKGIDKILADYPNVHSFVLGTSEVV